MGSNHKLLILAEVCKQRLLELRPENAQSELQKTYGIARIDKDPLEEKLEPMYVPTEDIKIINTGSLLEPTADNCNHSDRRYLSPIEVITILDEDENTEKDSNKETSATNIKLQADTNVTRHHTSKAKHKPSNYMERSSRAVDINLNTFAFGKFELEIIETDLVKPWKNAYKIMRKTGIMIIKVQHDHNVNNNPSIIRTTLVRKSNIYRHHLINEICRKHESDSKKTLRNQMMQTTNHLNYWYDTKGHRRSICFRINNPFQTVIGLRFLCNQRCDTTGYLPNLTKRGHNLILVITLEKHDMIIGRRTIEVCPTDLIK